MNKKLLLIFFNIFLLNYFQLCSQTTGEPIASFTLKGVVKLDGRLAKGVSLELTKDGREISKTITQRNGKYSFLMDESTTDTKNEYLIHISKEGAIPKTLSINTYVPKEQYSDIPYVFDLEVNLIETSVSGVILNFNSGKIKWVAAENKFNIDQEYQKIVQTEEKKMESDPDKYMTDIANQKKREKENFKRIADSLAKAKVDEEIRRVSGLKKEQEGAKRLKQSIKLVNIEQPVEYHTDTVPDVPITSIIFPKEKEEPVKITPISAPIAVQPEFDVADTYSLNSEKSKQRTIQKKMERKKSANFALKYETSNELTSLLDAIDEHDKKEKNNK